MAQTSTPKHHGEKKIYMLPETGDEYLKHLATVKVTGATAGTIETTTESFTSGHDVICVLEYVDPSSGISAEMTVTIDTNEAAVASGAFPGQAFRFGSATLNSFDMSSVTIAAGQTGAILKVYELPSYTSSDQVAYTQSDSYERPSASRYVKAKGDVSAYKRMLNREMTLDMTTFFQSYNHGVTQYLDTLVTTVLEVEDNVVGAVSERIIFGKYKPEPTGPNSGGEDDDDTVAITGEYQHFAVVDFS